MKKNLWQRFWSRCLPATKHDLKKLKKLIVMTQTEEAQALRDLTAQLKKIGEETSKTLAKVTELEGIIAAGGDVSPDVVQALSDLKIQAQATDDLVPDVTPTPTPTPTPAPPTP